MTNKAIARRLRLAAELIEIAGDNPFRAKAFGSAARAVETADDDVAALAAEGQAARVPGVGKGIATEIEGLVRTGRLDALDQALQALPAGLPDLLGVKGLGAKKVRALWQELGVTTLEALESAAVSGALAALPGFGKKTAENVLEEIERMRRSAGKLRIHDAFDVALPLLATLRATPGVDRADLAGALRRQHEVVDRIDVVASGEPDAIMSALDAHGVRRSAEVDEPAFFVGHHASGLPVVVHHPLPEAYGRALWAVTGDDAHVAAFADRFGMPGASADESAVYASAGLAPVPPALREGEAWLDAAASRTLPELVTVEDLRGTIHNHTTWSDGAHSLDEMAEAARARGLEYFVLCDHSRSLRIANGLSIERLLEQVDAVRRLNARFEEQGIGFRVLAGTECDILGDGELDYPDDVLDQLDFVVAAIHSRFKMTEAEATERLIRAIEHPLVDVLAHPTGRLLLRRPGYPIDHDAVIEACAATGTALEVNANPYRLDVDWRWVRPALERGVWISINPDAHSTAELDLVRWGVAVAQKGGLTAERCLPALGLDDLRRWREERRARARVA